MVAVGAPQKASEPKGRPVSGRCWKADAKRASTIYRIVNPTLSTTWDRKMELRSQQAAVKEREKELKQEKNAEFERKKAEKEERKKRKIENEFKSTAYQMIQKTEKLKAMSKKQLRQIRKTQVNKHGQVELVSPWGGPVGGKKGAQDQPNKKKWARRKKKTV